MAEDKQLEPLLKRAFIFLEDGDWSKADSYCEKVLDQDPENAQAYLGKLMAEFRVRRQEDLPNCELPFNNSKNFQKVVRFGGEKLSSVLSGYIDHINERNENTRLTTIYSKAVSDMNAANSELTYKTAAETFKTISGFKDSDELYEQCLERAEVYRKDEIYASAMSQMTENDANGYESAIETFEKISGWKDADEQICVCQRKIEELIEAQRLESKRQAEQNKEEQARIKKSIKARMTKCLVSFIVCLLSQLLLAYFYVRLVMDKYYLRRLFGRAFYINPRYNDVYLFILGALFCILGIVEAVLLVSRQTAKLEWHAINKDWESYQELMNGRQREAQRIQQLQQERMQKEREEKEKREAVAILTCPLCGSKNTKRISTLNRGVSIYMTGLASDKIGKQYECNNCGHKW